MRYVFVIDKQRCIGCHTCSVACRYENHVPANVWWNTTVTDGGAKMDTPAGEFPRVEMSYHTFACQHCDNPTCVAVCPTGATYKDEATGIVMQNTEACIGCKACVDACPFPGARTFLEAEPEYYIDVEFGSANGPRHLINTVEKCTMCAHRVERGLEPACVRVCPGVARYWGDFDDPESEVSKLLAARDWTQLNPEAGTAPSVFFLI